MNGLLGAQLLSQGGSLLSGIGQQIQGHQNRAYHEKMTREQWSREDNAVQRRVEDLKAAGLSPVLAAGSAATTSPPQISEQPRNTSQTIGEAMLNVLPVIEKSMDITQTMAQAALTREKKITEAYHQDVLSNQYRLASLQMWSADLTQREKAIVLSVLDGHKTPEELSSEHRRIWDSYVANLNQQIDTAATTRFQLGELERFPPHVRQILQLVKAFMPW